MASIAEVLRAKREKIEAQKEATKKLETTKPAQGKNTYRLLPSWRNDGTLFQEYGMHFVKGPDGKTAPALCHRKTFGDDHDCPVCNAIIEGMGDAQTDEERNEIKGYFASQRYIVNVINMKTNEVEMLEIGQSIYDGIENAILAAIDDDPDFDPTDPDNGHNLIINRSGSGMNTEYGVTLSMKPSKVALPEALPQLDQEVKIQAQKEPKYALETLAKVTGALAPAALEGSTVASLADLREVTDVEDEDVPDWETTSASTVIENEEDLDGLDELDDLLGDD